MSTTVLAAPALPAADPAVRRYGRFALFSAVYTYLLVVFGGLVRITESGLGCGDHWPKCNGRWIPEFTVPTLIEWDSDLPALEVLIGEARRAERVMEQVHALAA